MTRTFASLLRSPSASFPIFDSTSLPSLLLFFALRCESGSVTRLASPHRRNQRSLETTDQLLKMAASQSVPDDFSFGPRYGDAVDVTLTFSNIIFTIVPSSLLLLAAVVHLQHYYRQPTVAIRSPILWARMVSTERDYSWIGLKKRQRTNVVISGCCHLYPRSLRCFFRCLVYKFRLQHPDIDPGCCYVQFGCRCYSSYGLDRALQINAVVLHGQLLHPHLRIAGCCSRP